MTDQTIKFHQTWGVNKKVQEWAGKNDDFVDEVYLPFKVVFSGMSSSELPA